MTTERKHLRLRRLRRTGGIRRMVEETSLETSNLMAPIFVRDGTRVVEPVVEMPGVNRYSVDELKGYVQRLVKLGIPSVLLFGIPSTKDEFGTGAYTDTGVIPSAIAELKEGFPDLVVAADVCLCEYTSHGHCGVIEEGSVANDKTLPLLAKAASEYAKAGADVVAPSAMMDRQVGAIRHSLDEQGFGDTIIMGYSAKYASAFYGPFRNAAGSAPLFGDRKAYQMNPANFREAMREIESDIKEGADVIMVKPALSYLDVIARARARYDLPLAAYNVSGEYSMIKAASANSWIDGKGVMMEVLTSIKRAGADIIITYFAEEAASLLKEM